VSMIHFPTGATDVFQPSNFSRGCAVTQPDVPMPQTLREWDLMSIEWHLLTLSIVRSTTRTLSLHPAVYLGAKGRCPAL
jgi:hypothetical protein